MTTGKILLSFVGTEWRSLPSGDNEFPCFFGIDFLWERDLRFVNWI